MTSAGARQAGFRASATVVVDGARTGSAVLVAGTLLLTAGHVLEHQRGGSRPSTVEVEFPALAPGQLLAVRVLTGEREDAAADVAVLQLRPGRGRPGWLPEPVELWPGAAPPTRVEVFGFPLAERDATGVWREYEVVGPAAGGAKVQLAWREGLGAMPGHSGGPVFDLETGAVAGVLIEGSEAGRFDRYAPVRAAQAQWPQLPRPWQIAGQGARDHLGSRAQGLRTGSRPEQDLFRGRVAALARTRSWMRAEEGSGGRPLVITGQPGAGKSAVLARTVLHRSAAGEPWPGLVFHAASATHDDLLRALADLVDAPPLREGLYASLDAPPPDGDLWGVAVDALDEAASPQDRTGMASTLLQLARARHVRVLVATRPHVPHRDQAVDSNNYRAAAPSPNQGEHPRRYGRESLLVALGVQGPDAPTLIDLDTDHYFEHAGLLEYTGALLEQLGTLPGLRDPAAAGYRADTGLRRRLADKIVARADRNYLVAALAADTLSRDDTLIDPASPGFDDTVIPSGVGEALRKYLDPLDARTRAVHRGLLTALAYARGPGLPDHLWLAFAGYLGQDVTSVDLDVLRDSPAADYLVHTTNDRQTGRLTRLFHQALADELLAYRDSRDSDERGLVSLLTSTLRAPNSSYARTFLGDHAVAAGLFLDVLDNTDFMLYADFARVRPLLRSSEVRGSPEARTIRRALATAAGLEGPQRAPVLALAAAHLGLRDIHERYRRLSTGLRPRWAHAVGPDHDVLAGHTGPVYSLVITHLSDGRELIASAGNDGTVRVWDPDTGTERHTLTGHTGPAGSLVITQLRDGRELIASAGNDGTVRVWDPDTGTERHTLTGHAGPVGPLAVPRLRDGRELIASGGPDGIRLWDPETGTEHRITAPDANPVRELVVARAHEGRELLAATGEVGDDEEIRVWDPETGTQWGAIAVPTDPFSPLSVTHLPGGLDLIVTTGGSGQFGLFSPVSGLPESMIHRSGSGAKLVAIAHLPDGTDLIATNDINNAVQLHDPATGTVRHRLKHPSPHYAQYPNPSALIGLWTIGLPESGHVFVTADRSGTTRIWDPANDTERRTLTGHTGAVSAVTVVRTAEGRDRLVTAGADGTVRLWDPDHLTTVGADQPVITKSTLGSPADCQFIATAGEDGIVRVWEPDTGSLRRTIPDLAERLMTINVVRLLGGQQVLNTEVYDNTRFHWHPDTGACLETVRSYHRRSIWIAVAHLGKGREMLATNSYDGPLRPWGPDIMDFMAETVVGESGTTEVFGIAHLGNVKDALASTDWGCTVAFYRPDEETHRYLSRGRLAPSREEYVPTTQLSAYTGLQLPNGHRILATAEDSGAVRTWNTNTATLRHTLREARGTDGYQRERVRLAVVHRSDGRELLATADQSGTVTLWDPEAGTAHRTWSGHTAAVRQLAVAGRPDGRDLLASAGSDATVRLWDPESGEAVAVAHLLDGAQFLGAQGPVLWVVAGGVLSCFEFATP